jgi:hypothetical protein
MIGFRRLSALAVACAASAIACSSSSGSGSGSSGSATKFACASQQPTAMIGMMSASQACSSCFESMCSSQLSNAYGPGYASGDFGGACGSFINCTAPCACGDGACLGKCAPSMDCVSAEGAFAGCILNCASQCGLSTMIGTGGDGGGTVIPSTDASTSGGATAACYMGSTNTCLSPLDVNTCSSAGGTLMSTCPSAGLAGCCTTGASETCLYAPLTASDAMAACKNGTFSTSP